jgi:hypothetical protein
MGNHDLIARTREEPRDELQERFGPQYRGWVSYAKRPPSERMVCFLLMRDLSVLFTLVGACQLVAHRVGVSSAHVGVQPNASPGSLVLSDRLCHVAGVSEQFVSLVDQ